MLQLNICDYSKTL